jgi:hypothetical protein
MTPEPNPEARFVPLRMGMHHADDKSLKPEDFPVQFSKGISSRTTGRQMRKHAMRKLQKTLQIA